MRLAAATAALSKETEHMKEPILSYLAKSAADPATKPISENRRADKACKSNENNTTVGAAGPVLLCAARTPKGVPAAAISWKDRNMMPWIQQRLNDLLNESSCLRVFHGDVDVKVSHVTDVDGFASISTSGAKERRLFDMSLVVVFTATWLHMQAGAPLSSEGRVVLLEFGDHFSSDPKATCGMELKFLDQVTCPQDDVRNNIRKVLPLTDRIEIVTAVGASSKPVLAGFGLMHLVHEQLRRIAREFVTV